MQTLDEISSKDRADKEILDRKDYNKPNDAVLIDVEVASCQGDCNW